MIQNTSKFDWRFLTQKDNFARSVQCEYDIEGAYEFDRLCGFSVFANTHLYERETGISMSRHMRVVVESPWLKCRTALKFHRSAYRGAIRFDGNLYTLALTAEDFCEKNEQKEASDFLVFMENVFDRYFMDRVQKHDEWWRKETSRWDRDQWDQFEKNQTDMIISTLPCVRTEHGVKTLFLQARGVPSMLKKYDCSFCDMSRGVPIVISMENSGIENESDKFVKVAFEMIDVSWWNGFFRIEPKLIVVGIDDRRSYNKRLTCRRLLSLAMLLAPLLLPVYIVLELFDWVEFLVSAPTITKEWINNNCRKDKIDVIQRVTSFYRKRFISL